MAFHVAMFDVRYTIRTDIIPSLSQRTQHHDDTTVSKCENIMMQQSYHPSIPYSPLLHHYLPLNTPRLVLYQVSSCSLLNFCSKNTIFIHNDEDCQEADKLPWKWRWRWDDDDNDDGCLSCIFWNIIIINITSLRLWIPYGQQQ